MACHARLQALKSYRNTLSSVVASGGCKSWDSFMLIK